MKLKEQITYKFKLNHHLLTPVSMESWLKFHGQQNFSGPSKQNSILLNNGSRWGLFSKCKRKQPPQKPKRAPSSLSSVVQVSLRSKIDLKRLFTPFIEQNAAKLKVLMQAHLKWELKHKGVISNQY